MPVSQIPASCRLTRRPAFLREAPEDVGNESESASNRAFKREFVLPPATWRKSERPSARRAATMA